MIKLKTRRNATPLLQVRRNFQITIPFKLREALGLKEGDLVEADLLDNQSIVLKLREAVSKLRDFSDNEIEEWLKEDELDCKTLIKAQKMVGKKKK